MADVFITGSSDGLGAMAGQLLAARGHVVTLHARNAARAADAPDRVPDATDVLVADVSTLAGMRDLAAQASTAGPFDAVIHNVGLGYREHRRTETNDGLSQLWAVNVLAPYVLTALVPSPSRLVYLTSGMHLWATADLDDAQWTRRRWDGSQAYAETKLHDVLLALAVARRRPQVASNAVSPGWVATKMGGAGAPDDLDQGHRTQVWLAVGDDAGALGSGRVLYHGEPAEVHPAAGDPALQDRLLAYCEEVSGVPFDRSPATTGGGG